MATEQEAEDGADEVELDEGDAEELDQLAAKTFEGDAQDATAE